MNPKFENMLILIIPIFFVVLSTCIIFSACEHVVNYRFTACDESICVLKDFTNGP